MKVQLFIHIGQPKTGSSAIQAFLNYNRENLAMNHKVLYPNFSGSDFGKGFQHNHEELFINAKLNNDFNGCIETFKNCINYCEHNNITKLIISNEGFGWDWWPDLLNQIIKTLECEFKIVLYLRRQDHWVESAWKQWGHKNNEYNSIQDFSKKNNTDWQIPLTKWLQVFKPSDFVLRPFEKNAIGYDVVEDFTKIIGINNKSGFIAPPSTNLNINVGFNREIIEILKLCNMHKQDINDNRLLDFCTKVLPESYKKLDPFQTYGLLSPSERIEIVNKYEKSNNEIGRVFFGESRETLFKEPLPNPEEEWKPIEELTVKKIVPVFMDMLMSMQKQIDQINVFKTKNNIDVVSTYGDQNNYAFTEIKWENLLKKVKFNNQIYDIFISESGLNLTSLGSDPFFILPKLPQNKQVKAVKIEITTPVATTLKLYFKTGILQSYNEYNRLQTHLKAGRTKALLLLPFHSINGKFRIDPGCDSGKYIIHKIEITY